MRAAEAPAQPPAGRQVRSTGPSLRRTLRAQKTDSIPRRPGHYNRALEEAVQTNKSQWVTSWQESPLAGGKTFASMTPVERVRGGILETLKLARMLILDHSSRSFELSYSGPYLPAAQYARSSITDIRANDKRTIQTFRCRFSLGVRTATSADTF